MRDNNEESPIRPRLSMIGVTVSAGYLISLLVYAIVERGPFLAMKPNEFADFLAGAFAPLAFLWLVLGFVQQGIELRHSAKALYLQQEELRNSVEQQAALVEVSRQQLEMESAVRREAEAESLRLVKPRLILHDGGWSSSGGDRKFGFQLENIGSPCTEVEIVVQPRGDRFAKNALKSGDFLKFELDYSRSENLIAAEVTITYIDARGIPGTDLIKLPVKNGPNGSVFDKPQRVT